ncbi:MAG TPA: ABC transporter permease [Conexibacter sp.]|nr:ABC transporter permease [Conexibacter sp.]
MQRTVSAVLIAFSLVVAVFLMVRLLPGDPARLVAGSHASPEQLAAIRHQLGLDRSAIGQFGSYMGDLSHLRLGTSFQTGETVNRVIAERLPKTAELAGVSVALTLLLSIPLGLAAAALTRDGRNRAFGALFSGTTGLVASLPVFLIGSLLAFAFAVELQWLPIAGSDSLDSIVLPALSVSLLPIALLARIVRLEALSVLGQDYVKTARSKRLPARTIYLRHILPNVVAGTLTIAGVMFAQLIGGVVIVENIFAWPGLGTVLVQAVSSHDYPVVQGVTLLLGFVLVVTNAFVDVVLALMDPRSLVTRT